jgi:hypothetical protein
MHLYSYFNPMGFLGGIDGTGYPPPYSESRESLKNIAPTLAIRADYQTTEYLEELGFHKILHWWRNDYHRRLELYGNFKKLPDTVKINPDLLEYADTWDSLRSDYRGTPECCGSNRYTVGEALVRGKYMNFYICKAFPKFRSGRKAGNMFPIWQFENGTTVFVQPPARREFYWYMKIPEIEYVKKISQSA